MEKEKTLKQKMETFIKLNNNLQSLDNVIEEEKKKEEEKYLSKFRSFDADAKFTTKEKYLMDKCGRDPLENIRNDHKKPIGSPKIPVSLIIWASVAFLGIILTIITFVNIFTNNGDTPSIEVVLAIVGGIGLFITWSDYSNKKDKYNKELKLYNEQEGYNKQLRENHDEWKKSVELATNQYEQEKLEFIASQKKTKKEFENANKKYFDAIKLIDDRFDDDYTPLFLQVSWLERELLKEIKRADDKIPASKKYGLDLFEEDAYNDFFDEGDMGFAEAFELTLGDFMKTSPMKVIPILALHLKGDDLVDALLKYYREEHLEEIEQEKLRLEEERNELERERIQTYKMQEEENRRQQERFQRKQEEYERKREYESRQEENQFF